MHKYPTFFNCFPGPIYEILGGVWQGVDERSLEQMKCWEKLGADQKKFWEES